MKSSRLFLTVFAALAITACSNDNELTGEQPGNSNENVSDAYAAFSISIPNTSVTRAAMTRTDPGTTAENGVKSLHVFIYDAESPFTPTVAQFTVADGSLKQETSGSSKWVTNKAVRVKKVDKYIFAGINLTPEIVSYITTNGYGAFNYKAFEQATAILADATNGFVMFNDTYPALTPAASLSDNESDASANHISISVERVVAKAAVFQGQNYVVNGGGQMTNLTYGWRNLNKKFYFIQDGRDNLIKDYNWDSFSPTDFTRGTDALPVYNYGATASAFSYASENAFQFVKATSVVDGATFLSVSGVFTPQKVVSTALPTPAEFTDFELVNNPNAAGSTFYIVRTSDGIANYFADGTIAQKFADLCIAGAAGMPTLAKVPYTLVDNTYTNGMCYYHIFVNGKAVAPQAPYNIYRNQYFKVTVNSIQAPGNPSDNFDDGEVITPDAWIGVDIEVNPWEVIEEDHDL